MTADDDDLDDASSPSMRSMRAVWVSMRDEEPPSAGMSALLAAAAAKADQLREKEQPAWWERVFALLRKPPVLAFATVMILIGGAVLVTRTSEQDAAAPMVTAEPPAGATAVEERVATGVSSDPAAPMVPAPESAAPAVPAPEPAQVSTHAPKPDPVREAPGEARAVEKPRDIAPPKKQAPRARPQTYQEEAAALEDRAAAGKVGKDVDTSVDTAGTALESPAPPRTPVTPKPAPVKAIESADDTQPLSDRAATKPSPLEQLARQAESAASRGDCPAVRTIAARIQQQDASFYKQRIAQHAAISKCL